MRWDWPLNLTQPDLEELAEGWPTLESLHLNCQPIPELSVPTLTLQALIPFARHCPRLRELGLYFDAQVTPPEAFEPDLVRFKSLNMVSVGSSHITTSEPTVLTLSRLCPVGCQIVAGVRWPDAFGIALDRAGIMDDRRIHMTEWWSKWNDVIKVLPLVTKARLDERTRLLDLQRRMEGLALTYSREREMEERLEHEQ